MSRTDKDIKYTLFRSLYGHIEHDHRHGVCVEETQEDALVFSWWALPYECRSMQCNHTHATCTYNVDRPSYYGRGWDHPNKEDRNVYWNGPERRRERDGLRDYLREYNYYGSMEDDDFDNRQHRHGISWYLW